MLQSRDREGHVLQTELIVDSNVHLLSAAFSPDSNLLCANSRENLHCWRKSDSGKVPKFQ
jgi:hypothetical protein